MYIRGQISVAMSYLKFDKNLMINLEHSLTKEMLRTNKSGAYSYSTVVDCNTRKHHGVLVLPLPEVDGGNHVLLSSLDATVIQRGAEFNLGLHKYPGDHFSPKGHKYIREYTCDYNPSTLYRVGGVILSKDVIFVSHENRLLIRYTLLEAHSPTTLRLRPFLAFRNVNSLCRENHSADNRCEPIENGVKTCLYPGYPTLHLQLSLKNTFTHAPDWYRNIEYMEDQEQGFEYQEDLLVPGYFDVPIKKGQSLYFSAGTSVLSPRKMATLFQAETELRTPRTSFTNCLKNAAYQFYCKHEDKQRYIIAGYPWFNYRARDLFISLPGITIAAKDPDLFEAIMHTGEKAIRNYMAKRPLDCAITGIDDPDVLLWAIWSLQKYAEHVGIEPFIHRFGDLVYNIIDFIRNQRHENLLLHENGLLFTQGTDKPVSWMNAVAHGKPVVPRTGYLVEFNALWYNALRFSASIAEANGFSDLQTELEQQAAQTGASFLAVFYNKHGYLFDYVNGDIPEWSVRPSQIIAVSLNYSPLERVQKKTVLDFVTKELLTPKGLRSLSPKSPGYTPECIGNEEQRIRASNQGAAWPWLIGPYLEAYLKIYQTSGLIFAQRIIYGFEEELSERGIGTISELFDGDPPYKGRGGISYAMNVAELLRIHRLVKDKINQMQET